MVQALVGYNRSTNRTIIKLEALLTFLSSTLAIPTARISYSNIRTTSNMSMTTTIITRTHNNIQMAHKTSKAILESTKATDRSQEDQESCCQTQLIRQTSPPSRRPRMMQSPTLMTVHGLLISSSNTSPVSHTVEIRAWPKCIRYRLAMRPCSRTAKPDISQPQVALIMLVLVSIVESAAHWHTERP